MSTPPSEEYQMLQTCLRDRYTDRAVLTFTQIEGVIGLALPETAWRREEWWATTDRVPRSAQSQSWTLARTAAVNLIARTVVFDRETPASHAGNGGAR
jgi:hypothetical protein